MSVGGSHSRRKLTQVETAKNNLDVVVGNKLPRENHKKNIYIQSTQFLKKCDNKELKIMMILEKSNTGNDREIVL